MKRKIMIVPIARVSDTKRIETSVADDNILYCLHAIEGISLKQFDNIFFVITQKCIDTYNLDVFAFEEQMKNFSSIYNTNVELIVLQNETSSQADTIVSALLQLQIFDNAAVFCKDGDSFYHINNDVDENSLMVYDIEKCNIVDPKNKSYVSVDMNDIVTNTIEKTIISKYFNCGGYFFEDVQDLIRTYEELIVKYGVSPKMSNIIQYLMLYKNKTFNAVICSNYNDFAINKQ